MKELEQKLRNYKLKGYVMGMDRSVDWTESLVAHIYKGEYDDLDYGLCKRSMDENGNFSIFRNNVGRKGICKICLRNLLKLTTNNE